VPASVSILAVSYAVPAHYANFAFLPVGIIKVNYLPADVADDITFAIRAVARISRVLFHLNLLWGGTMPAPLCGLQTHCFECCLVKRCLAELCFCCFEQCNCRIFLI